MGKERVEPAVYRLIQAAQTASRAEPALARRPGTRRQGTGIAPRRNEALQRDVAMATASNRDRLPSDAFVIGGRLSRRPASDMRWLIGSDGTAGRRNRPPG